MSFEPDREPDGGASAADDERGAQPASGRPSDHRPSAFAHWYPGSIAERLWDRLSAIDVINRGMLFAAVLLLSFVPFIIILEALAGRSAVTSLTERFGLSHDAATVVGHVLTSPSATSNAVSGLSWVFFLLSGISAAAAIQELYEKCFDVQGRGMRDTPRRVVWLCALVGALGLAGWAQPWLHAVGGPVLVGAAVLVLATGFWWFSMWLLLAGKLSWQALFPSALATGVCWLGMEVVFRLTLSDTITSNNEEYGPIGVVFALMSLLIAIGVVIMLGAVFGVVWRERRSTPPKG